MKKNQVHTCSYLSPIGNLLILADERALLRLDFEDERSRKRIEELSTNKEVLRMDIDCSCLPVVVQETINWLNSYFSGKKIPAFPSIRFEDTPFRILVWNMLLDIPYSKTVSYADMAHLVAKAKGISKMSAQAIGQAVGKNPISIIVPCHRVIGAKGELIGYGGGLWRKKFLLELEEKTQEKFCD